MQVSCTRCYAVLHLSDEPRALVLIHPTADTGDRDRLAPWASDLVKVHDPSPPIRRWAARFLHCLRCHPSLHTASSDIWDDTGVCVSVLWLPISAEINKVAENCHVLCRSLAAVWM